MSLIKINHDVNVIAVAIDIDPKDIRSVDFNSVTSESSIELERDTLIRGVLFKGGTRVTFHEGSWNVKSGFLARDTGREVKYNLFIFKAGERIKFDINGEVSSGYNIYEGGIIQPKVIIKTGILNFFPNGHLSSALNIAPFKVGRYMTKQGHAMFHNPEEADTASVLACYFNETTRWDEFEAAHMSKGMPARISFSRGGSLEQPGKILEFSPVFDILIDGILCPKESPIVLYESQSLKYCELGIDKIIQGINLNANRTFLTFFKSKRLESIFSSHAVTVVGKIYNPWTKIWLNEDGTVQN
ncbi:MAG: hypothetical protein HWE24_17890 [Oceanospirillaceae bacterium]|nr:hypothetical protein [Oceanospirillaceae bacterium]